MLQAAGSPIDHSKIFLNDSLTAGDARSVTPKDISECYSKQDGKTYTYLSRLMTFAKKGVWLNDKTISQVLQSGKTASLGFRDEDTNNQSHLDLISLKAKTAMDELNQNTTLTTKNKSISEKENLENLQKLVKKTEKITRFAEILTKVKENISSLKKESEVQLETTERFILGKFNNPSGELKENIEHSKELIKNGKELKNFLTENKKLNTFISEFPKTSAIFLKNPQMLTLFKNDNEALLLFINGYKQLNPKQQMELLEVMKEPTLIKASLDGGNIQRLIVNPKTVTYLNETYKSQQNNLMSINGLFFNHLLSVENLSKEGKNLPALTHTNFKIKNETHEAMKIDSNKKTFDINKPENNLTQTINNPNNSIKIAIVSGYPKDKENLMKRSGDPIADDVQCKTFKTDDGGEVVLYSGADGCGWGEKAQKAAEYANAGFIENCEKELQEKNDKRTLMEVALKGVKAAQSKIVENNKFENEIGETTHAGMVLKKDKEGNADGVITAIGDMKAFILKKDGTVVEITKGNRGNATNLRDPGGSLGLSVATKTTSEEIQYIADKRNISVFSFKAEKGDQVMLMSDGGSDNLDPYYVADRNKPTERLYLRPEVAKQELLSSNLVSESDKQILLKLTLSEWKNESADLGTLKEIFITYQLQNITQNQDDPSKAVAEFALNNVKGYKASKETGNPTTQELEKYPGKPDHISVGSITV